MLTDTLANSDFLRPLVNGWLSKVELAKRSGARSCWEETVRECECFYSGKTGFMWDQSNIRQFWSSNIPAPTFRFTLNKAFELVAIFGPTLLFNLPNRKAEAKRIPEIPLPLFGDPNNPQMQQFLQQMQMENQQELMIDQTVATLMQTWLNYTPREMPDGGLLAHGERAITDALITGRGVLWNKPYKMPGSGRTLTGTFRDDPKNLITDPDFSTISECRWVAKRCVHPTHEVERRYKLKPGSLKNRGTLESAWSIGESVDEPSANMHRAAGQTNDLMVYYEIYSKMGPGTRLSGVNSVLKDHLESVAGDFCYLVIAPEVPYPLNLPEDMIRNGATDGEVREALSWPIPYWGDDRWPFSLLEFYPEVNSAYPLPPLGPGLGELKFLNTMVSHLANRIWKSSRDFIACAQSAMNELRKYLEEGRDMTIIPVPDIQGDIDKVLKWIQQPQTNFDVWQIIDAVAALFDKRVGLTELAYGLNPGGTQNRTAEETASKRQAFSIRPEYMQRRVEAWMSDACTAEAFCARLFVTGEDVEPLMGKAGRMAWEKYVMSTDVERVLRQMQYTVEAGSMRRPNKDRDVANASQAIQIFAPLFTQYAQGTGNFEPINALIDVWAKAADMDMSQMRLTPPPPPDPNQPSPEQQAAQAEMQARQQELQLEQQSRQQDMQMTAAERQQAMQMDALAASQRMQQDAQKHELDLELKAEDHSQKIQERVTSEMIDALLGNLQPSESK